MNDDLQGMCELDGMKEVIGTRDDSIKSFVMDMESAIKEVTNERVVSYIKDNLKTYIDRMSYSDGKICYPEQIDVLISYLKTKFNIQ